MATNSRHSMSRMSGIALAAFVVASMSAHAHQSAVTAQSFSHSGTSAVSNATLTSVAGHTQTLRATNVDLDGMVPTIIHHY